MNKTPLVVSQQIELINTVLFLSSDLPLSLLLLLLLLLSLSHSRLALIINFSSFLLPPISSRCNGSGVRISESFISLLQSGFHCSIIWVNPSLSHYLSSSLHSYIIICSTLYLCCFLSNISISILACVVQSNLKMLFNCFINWSWIHIFSQNG